MKNLKTTLLLVFALIAALPATFAQEISTQGTDFWVSFMGNGFRDNGYPSYLVTQLMISAKNDCSGSISNPQTGWSQNFTVFANTITSIDIPENQGYNPVSSYEWDENKGLQIVTTDTVSVYCTNIATNSFDATYVLPIQALADDYMVQTYDQSSQYTVFSEISEYLTSAFLIVAVEDETTIDITPSVETLGGKPAGQTFSVTLQRGQSYQVRSKNTGDLRDLSGSRVTAHDCKKIAVFNGNTLTTVPNLDNGFDHIFEQAMPLRSWGKKFVVTQSSSRSRDFVKVTSSANNNDVSKNGTIIANLQYGESYTFELSASEKSCYIETTAPSAIYLFNTTGSDDSGSGSGNGDPSMLWISPVEQRMTEVTFTTFSGDAAHNSSIDHHFVNIIVASEDVANVKFDGALIPADNFEPVNGNANYSFVREEISHDVHDIACPNGFNAHIYGFGQARGYAYLVGSKATDLSTTLFIDDIVTIDSDTISNCALEPLTFAAEISYNDYELEWVFGDGHTSTDNPTTHTYATHDLFQASLIVKTQETPCQDSSAIATVFYIDARSEEDQNYTDQICAGQFYNGHGFNNILVTNDTILTRQIPGTNPDCFSIVNVDITCYPVSDTTITDYVCFKGPDTYNGNGFSIYFDEPGTFTDSHISPNAFGCDRWVTLELIVSNLESLEPVSASECDSYTWPWNGETYTESGTYTDTLPDPSSGCYQIGRLNLQLGFTPDPTEIYSADPHNGIPHWVISPTEFEIHYYDFNLWENKVDNVWDSVVWSFDREIDWELEPYGDKNKFCRIAITERLKDTVWLIAKVYNQCETDQGIERRFWLISSFFDIDEQGTELSGFNVVPNPNNGQMALQFEHLTGRIDIKVYDMRGVLIDNFQTFNDQDSTTCPYDMKTRANGIYFFVATGKEGTLAKKVVVTP